MSALALLNISAAQDITVTGHPRIIDVDTVYMGDLKLRFDGIDGPDSCGAIKRSKHKQKIWQVMNNDDCKAIEEFKDVATQFLYGYANSEWTCRLNGNVSYDRHIATCYLPDNSDISSIIVGAGYAIEDPIYSDGRYQSHMIEAIKSRAGIWRSDRVLPHHRLEYSD